MPAGEYAPRSGQMAVDEAAHMAASILRVRNDQQAGHRNPAALDFEEIAGLLRRAGYEIPLPLEVREC